MSLHDPLVSIIILAYNEEKTISRAINSALAQTYASIEIIVCDNASTDGTPHIVSSFMQKYSKVKHVNRSQNIGAAGNLLDGIKRAKGDYFVFCGGHDIISSNYVQQLLESILSSPSAVVAMGITRWVDSNGKELDTRSSLLDTSGQSFLGKYISLMFQNQHYLYGLISRQAYLSCLHARPPITPGSGELVLQELASKGDFVISPNAVWYRGTPRSKELIGQRLYRYRQVLHQSNAYKIFFSFFPLMQYWLMYLVLPFRIFKPVNAIIVFSATFPILLMKLPALVFGDFQFYLYWLSSLRRNHKL